MDGLYFLVVYNASRLKSAMIASCSYTSCREDGNR